MKKIILLLALNISIGHLSAQIDTLPIHSFTSQVDSAYAPLLDDPVPYDRLYDRVFPWAGLRMTSSGDTIDFSLFMQAWYELELSRLSTSLTQSYASYNNLMDTVYHSRLKNRLQVAAIAVKMATIDTLAYTDGRLDSTAAGWDNAIGQPSPFIIENVTMGAISMDEFLTGRTYKLQLKSAHIQNTDRTAIQSIKITKLVNGIDITLFPGQIKTFTVTDTGKFYVTIRMNFIDGSHFINIQHIEVNDPATPRSLCDVKKLLFESDIPFQGPDELVGTTSLADAYIFYHLDENGECKKRLLKNVR